MLKSQEAPSSTPSQSEAGNPGGAGTLLQEGASDFSQKKPPAPLLTPWWMKVVPFFLSAFFFLSALFAVFAPLPLLFVYLKGRRKWGWVAILSNALVVGLAGGVASLAIYFVFVVALALPMGELLKRKIKVEKAALFTLFSMAVAALGIGLGYAHFHHVNLVSEVRQQIATFVDMLGESVSGNANLVNVADIDEWKHSLKVELPSALAVFSLVLIWANLVIILRANPNQVREKLGLDSGFLKKWRAPEFLVWPTIASGFFLLVDFGKATDVSLNIFKFLMAIYALQGLSILSFFFDLWKVKGIFRFAGFLISVFVMMPLLLSLGFFDLWFDFRSKFRQT